MPLKQHHRPAAAPLVAGLVLLGVLAAAGGGLAGLSGDFCGTTLMVLAGVLAAGVVLDLVLLSHADRHRY